MLTILLTRFVRFGDFYIESEFRVTCAVDYNTIDHDFVTVTAHLTPRRNPNGFEERDQKVKHLVYLIF